MLAGGSAYCMQNIIPYYPTLKAFDLLEEVIPDNG